MINNELVYVIIGLILSLGAFSLLLGDNRMFRLCASIMTGALCAFACVQLVNDFFLPLINGFIAEGPDPAPDKLILAAAVIVSIILILTMQYSHSDQGGVRIQELLLAAVTAIVLSGAVNGTLTAFFRSLIGKFRVRTLAAEDVKDISYWVNAGTVLLSAIAALLYTRHYAPAKAQKTGRKDFVRSIGQIVIGITFGAIAAGCFIASATIFINNITEIAAAVRILLK